MPERQMIGIGLATITMVIAVLIAFQPVSVEVLDFYRNSTHVAQRTGINLIEGAGITVTAADDVGDSRVNYTLGTAAYLTIEDEGTPLTARTTLDFTGAGVTCTDVAGDTSCDFLVGVDGGEDLQSTYDNETAPAQITLTDAIGGIIFDGASETVDATLRIIGGDFTVEGLSNPNMLDIDANAEVIGFGTDAIGSAFISVAPSYTHTGIGTLASLFSISGTVTGKNGDTSRLIGASLEAAIITQTVSNEDILDVTQLWLEEPNITDNLSGTGDINRASTLALIGIPTEGTVNAGLIIDGGVSNDSYLALTSDIATGLSTAVLGDDVATNWFLSTQQASNTVGGVAFQVLAKDGALGSPWIVDVYGGTATTAKSTIGLGLISFYVTEHDGSNALANVTANGNIFSLHAQVGGVELTRWMADVDGDTYQSGDIHFFTGQDVVTDTGALGLISTDGAVNITLGGGAGDDFNVDSGTLVVESDNNRVGIGTATPEELLHVIGGSETFLIGDTTTGFPALRLWGSHSSDSAYIQAGNASDDTDAELRFTLYNTTSTNMARLHFYTDIAFFGGNVGIGDTTPTEAILVVGDAGAGDIYASFPTFGTDTLCWDGTGASLITDCSSLREHKTNIVDLHLGLETVLQLQPREFNWIESIGGKRDLGFVAEEVEAVSSLLVDYRENDQLSGVRYRQLTALLTKAIQELTLRIERLEALETKW